MNVCAKCRTVAITVLLHRPEAGFPSPETHKRAAGRRCLCVRRLPVVRCKPPMGCVYGYCGYFPSLLARTLIQYPPMTERALKPTLSAVLVSLQSEMGTRDFVSLMYL